MPFTIVAILKDTFSVVLVTSWGSVIAGTFDTFDSRWSLQNSNTNFVMSDMAFSEKFLKISSRKGTFRVREHFVLLDDCNRENKF